MGTLSCIFATNNITNAGTVIVHDNNNQNEEDEDLLPGRYRHGLRLLNREEVLSLPEIEYKSERIMFIQNQGGGSDNDGSCGGEEEQSIEVSIGDFKLDLQDRKLCSTGGCGSGSGSGDNNSGFGSGSDHGSLSANNSVSSPISISRNHVALPAELTRGPDDDNDYD